MVGFLLLITCCCGVPPAAGRAGHPGGAGRDALRRIVRKDLPRGYDWQHLARWDLRAARYIRACGALGDYYVSRYKACRRPAQLRAAMYYYSLVTDLTEGTDSDLGDADGAVRERNKVCRRVARLYNDRYLPLDSLRSIYVGRYVDAARIDAGNIYRPQPNDTIAVLRLLPGSSRLSPDAVSCLTDARMALSARPAQKIVVTGGAGYRSVTRQVSWSQANAVIACLVAQSLVPRSRIIMSDPGRQPLNTVVVRYAAEGEDGPDDLPPPYPGLWD